MSPGRVIEEKDYDYIICGGGTAGCVIAGRLAEDTDVNILLIEAGPDNENLENVHMVGGLRKMVGSELDWNIVTTPMKGVNDRQVEATRGKFLGGSSGINGTLCIRGSRRDYDDWNLPGWSGEEMFHYMSKSETFHGKPWFQPGQGAHGTDGPLHTEPYDLAPIGKLLLESMQSEGLPLHHDMFTTGDIPHGCGHAVRTHHEGLRTTAADFVTKTFRRQNIEILNMTTVDKVNVEERNGSLHATSVDILSTDGRRRTVKATREIIVSGGTYCSPAILLRSGIGPKHELDSLGIPCVIDVPGVGQNLADHPIVWAYYETEKEGLTNDHLIYHGDAMASTYQLYQEKKAGALSTFPFGAFAFARLDDRLKDEPVWKKDAQGRDPMGLTSKQPNIEIFTTEMYGPGPAEDAPVNSKHVFGMISMLISQRSRGSVTLKSANPLETPIVDHNYLADPLDALVMSEGVKLANEVVLKGAGTRDIVKGSWPSHQTHHTYTEREQWVQFVRERATTCYHPTGTCKMGSDDMSVLDEKLCVRGVSGLRVADASAMPKGIGGHTQMPVYGIAEKTADLIKGTLKN